MIGRWTEANPIVREPENATFGPFKVLARTDRMYVVVDFRRPLARATVGEPFDRFAEACGEAKRLHETEQGWDHVG